MIKILENIKSFSLNSKVLYYYFLIINIYGSVVHIFLSFRDSSLLGYPIQLPRYFYGYAVYNILIVIFLLLYKKVVMDFSLKVIQFYREKENQFARKVIFFSIMLVVSTFSLKIHPGFFYYGICGWVEVPVPSIRNEGHELEKLEHDPSLPSFLHKSINLGNIKYLDSDISIIRTRPKFLHFKNETLPTNFDITPYVFDYVIEDSLVDNGRTYLYENIIKKGYLNLRSRKWWFYPNHSPYQRIDYSNYPPATELSGFSSWILWVRIYKNEKKTELLQAVKRYEIQFN